MATDRKRTIDMPELDQFTTDEGRKAKLEIRATGGQGRVYSTATVMYYGDGCVSFVMHADYSERLEQINARATQKNIDEMFARCTTGQAIALIASKARNHYAKKHATTTA